MSTTDDLLESIYTNPKSPGSFGGAWPLFLAAKKRLPTLKLQEVKTWLEKNDTYTLHKQAYRKFKRNRIYVGGVDHQWELDLVDMQQHSIHNDGFRYMLTCIDSFSKMAWVMPLKDKGARSICEAFIQILQGGRKPDRVRTDKGREFVNVQFGRRRYTIFTSQNDDIKCAIVERFNRTLKARMYRYFTEKRTRKWIKIIDDLVSSYNTSYHRSIKTSPINVTIENEHVIKDTLYGTEKIKHARLSIGDYVRISANRRVFVKGYLPQWSDEIFRIYKVLKRRTEPLYAIKDLKEVEIEGTFYERELQKVHFDQDKRFIVETIRNEKDQVEKYNYW